MAEVQLPSGRSGVKISKDYLEIAKAFQMLDIELKKIQLMIKDLDTRLKALEP